MTIRAPVHRTALALTDAAITHYGREEGAGTRTWPTTGSSGWAWLCARVDAVATTRDEVAALADDLSARDVHERVLEDIRTFTALA